MSTSDKKEYALVTYKIRPRARRSVITRDYSLPKPYRRMVFAEEQPGTSKMKAALWAATGVLLAGLVAELAALAQEHLRQRDLPIIAAAALTAPQATAPLSWAEVKPPSSAPDAAHGELATVGDTASFLPTGSPEQQAQLSAKTGAASTAGFETGPRPAAKAGPAPWSAATAPLRKLKGTHLPLAVPVPETDPDVVLITAILLLAPGFQTEAPGPASACVPGVPKDTPCAELHGMLP